MSQRALRQVSPGASPREWDFPFSSWYQWQTGLHRPRTAANTSPKPHFWDTTDPSRTHPLQPLTPANDTHRQHEHCAWGARQAIGPRKTWAPRGTLQPGRKENWSERQRDIAEQQCENERSESRLGNHRAKRDSIAMF